MWQFNVRELQLQPREETAHRVEGGADLVPGCLDGRDDGGLDPVPHGCGCALDTVEQAGGRALYGLEHRSDLAFDPVHYGADGGLDAVPYSSGGCFYGIENCSHHGLHGIDLCSDQRNDTVPDAGEEGNDTVPYRLE